MQSAEIPTQVANPIIPSPNPAQKRQRKKRAGKQSSRRLDTFHDAD